MYLYLNILLGILGPERLHFGETNVSSFTLYFVQLASKTFYLWYDINNFMMKCNTINNHIPVEISDRNPDACGDRMQL